MTKDICIIVPYRDREQHLSKFAPHMNAFLASENLSFDLLIVEQTVKKPFNRAKLLNVGYDFAKEKYKNYVFHDVDMLPIVGKATYAPVDTVTHYAAIVEQFGWNLAYQNYVGGVTAFTDTDFLKINGFCNEYWGWGAEDDDLFRRCVTKGINIMRRSNMYASLSHERVITKDLYDANLRTLSEWDKNVVDGLSTLHYEILEEKTYPEYIKITVEI